MGDLHMWIPIGNGSREIAHIPEDYVKNFMLKHIEHEPGHTVAAHHSGAMIIGIAIGFLPVRNGMFLYSSYGWGSQERPDVHAPTIEEECIVKAAGPAAELIFHGSYDPQGASGDLQDIAGLTGIPNPSFDPYMARAQHLLRAHEEEVRAISILMERRINELSGVFPGAGMAEYPTLVRFADGHMGHWLVNDADLMLLLKPWQDPLRPRCVLTTRADHSHRLVTMRDTERHHELEICTACLPFAKEQEWFRSYSILTRETTGSP
jgi:hypothetical protein